jgi:hypothetical protein
MTDVNPEKRYNDNGSEVQADAPDYHEAAPAPDSYATDGEVLTTDADTDDEK